MSEHIYKDYIPANARVVVDYTKPKEQRVSFSYPTSWDYKKAVWKRAFPTIASFWFSLNAQIIMHGAIFGGTAYVIYYLLTHPSFFESANSSFNYIGLLELLLLALYFILPPVLFTYIKSRDKDKLAAVVPKAGYYNALLSQSLRRKVFTTADLTSDNKIVIPQFKNVFLNFNCSGDFDRFLERIEIVEYPFSYQPVRFGLSTLFKTKMGELKRNEWEFRAVFHFSKKPLKGELDVMYH